MIFASRRVRSGEADFTDLFVSDKSVPDGRAVTGQDLEDTLWKTGFET